MSDVEKMADAEKLRDANPWHPMTDPVDLKHLGKLLEELTELAAAASRCGSAVARCIIQGIDEAEPVTGKINRKWLEDEIADVLANSGLVIDRFNLSDEKMTDRARRKMAHLRQWHGMA